METFLPASFFALGAVILAEMGDKTQLLAMAFAAKFKTYKVMLGILVATVLNHALAVAAGNFITRFSSVEAAVQALASASFIFFGLWTIRGDKLSGEENRKTRFGAAVTVGVAFFAAEMGDKTQLATIALAAKFPQEPAGILVGTTLGMLVADGLGILMGNVLRKKMPERKIKFLSAGAFILFGLIGIYQFLRDYFRLDTLLACLVVAAAAALAGLAAYFIIVSAQDS
jgi:putative Ca2+/H+ antiporter (TMEM165/GDT1 family)